MTDRRHDADPTGEDKGSGAATGRARLPSRKARVRKRSRPLQQGRSWNRAALYLPVADLSPEELHAKIRDQDAVIRELRESLAEAIGQVGRLEEAHNDRVPLALLSVSRDWIVLEANEAAGQLWGRKREALVGASLWSLMGGQRAEKADVVSSLAAHKEGDPVEYESFSPVLKKWLKVHASPSPEGLRLWFRDLTPEKNQLEMQAWLWRQQKLLVDNSPDMLMRFGPSLACTFANRAVRQVLGIDADVLVGKKLKDAGIGEAAEPMEKALSRAVRTAKALSEEFEVAIKGGKRFLSFRAIPEQGLRGGVESVLVVAQDITERRALEAQLRESQKLEALGTLTGGIAHDFNNILFAIIGFTELMAGRIAKGTREEHYMRRVMEASLRGRELVRQMLTFSRKAEPEKKPLRLFAIVKETVTLLRASLPATIRIRTGGGDDAGLILADATQVQQVVMNLCTNAAYAMREKGGILDIRIAGFEALEENPLGIDAGRYVKLSVRDTGAGIPADIIDRIFDPFFTTKETGEGTGLGLSVVHGIVKQSRGAITVESEPGHGALFTVYFPVFAGKTETEGAIDQALAGGSERVLFIDDEEALVEMGADILADLGYEVTSRTSGMEALSLLKEDISRFDLIVTDQTMPEMTGMDLAREILAIRPEMPVILCTGYSSLVNEKKARSAGIGDFLMKPYTRKELSEAVGRVLRPPSEKGGSHG